VAELQRRHRSQVGAGAADMLAATERQPDLRRRLRLMIDAAIRAHRREPALHRAFSEELPRSARQHDAGDEEEELRIWKRLLRPFLANVPDPDLAVFLCRAAGHAAIHEAVSDHPEWLDRPLFAAELTTLLVGYLRRPRRPS
jgi:hypothetical protein